MLAMVAAALVAEEEDEGRIFVMCYSCCCVSSHHSPNCHPPPVATTNALLHQQLHPQTRVVLQVTVIPPPLLPSIPPALAASREGTSDYGPSPTASPVAPAKEDSLFDGPDNEILAILHARIVPAMRLFCYFQDNNKLFLEVLSPTLFKELREADLQDSNRGTRRDLSSKK